MDPNRRQSFVKIGDAQFALRSDGIVKWLRAPRPGRDLRRGPTSRPGVRTFAHILGATILVNALPAALARVGAFSDPTRSKHRRFDFLLGKRQRRQHGAGAKHVADARLSIDVSTLSVESFAMPHSVWSDMPSSCAAPLIGKRCRRNWIKSSERCARDTRDLTSHSAMAAANSCQPKVICPTMSVEWAAGHLARLCQLILINAAAQPICRCAPSDDGAKPNISDIAHGG